MSVAARPAPLLDRNGPAYRWLVSIAGLVAFMTSVFSSTIVNVAVPNVMGAFGVGHDKVQFLATAFLATMTASLLLNTWIASKMGPRAAFLTALGLFTVGSLICAVSPTLEGIIVGRVIQGFGSGMLQPIVMLTLFRVFPPDRRGLAMGLFSMAIVGAIGIGPYLGGLTIDHFDWRLIFIVPLPAVAVAGVMGLLLLPDREPDVRKVRFDSVGYVLLCVMLFCLMTGIANGQRYGWRSDGILVLFALTISAGGGFILSQLRPEAGLLDVTLFRNIPFAAMISVAFLFGMANFSTIYVYPIFGQLVQGYTPTVAGFLILPGTLVAAILLPAAGRLSDEVAPQIMICIGIALFAASNILMAAADANTMFVAITLFIFIGRIGQAFVTPTISATALKVLPGHKLQQGAGILNFCMLFGGACGINSYVVVLERRTQIHGEALTTTQTAANPATRELLEGIYRLLGEEGFPVAQQSPVALKYLGEIVQAQANTFGFQDGFIAITIVSLVAIIPTSLLLLHRR